MAKTYEQLQKQITQLQAEAEKLRRQELTEVIARIRHAIDFYGLTAEDLGLGAAKAPRAKAVTRKARKTKGKAAAAPVADVKYRDDAGHTWAGRGKRPQWLREQLEAGRSLDEFRVQTGS